MENLTQRLDRLPLSRFHRRLLITSGLGWMFDSMDLGIVSFVIAALIRDWHLSNMEAGLIGSIGFVGMFIGAALAGSLSDRFGRRSVFQLTLLIYSIASGLSALAFGLVSLLVLRFFVGLGLGGELPVASTLVSEFAPARRRGRMIVLLESFWAYGWVIAALISFFVIPSFTWRAALAIGAVPAFYVFVLRRSLPESPRYLQSKGRYAEAEAVVREVEKSAGVAPGKVSPRPAPEPGKAGTSFVERLREIWSPGFARRTAMLWILWFGLVYSYYGIFTWLPSILAQNHTLIRSFEYTLFITLAQIPGYFSAAYLVDRLGRRVTLASYLLLSGVFAFLFGQAGSDTLILVFGCLMSFFNLGAWGVVYTYTPENYPTRMRGTGAGLAASFGRIGGIIGPYVVGVLLGTAGIGTFTVFTMFGLVLFLIAIVVAVLGRETKGKTLEEIAG